MMLEVYLIKRWPILGLCVRAAESRSDYGPEVWPRTGCCSCLNVLIAVMWETPPVPTPPRGTVGDNAAAAT